MSKINLEMLTPEQKLELLDQLEAEKRQKEENAKKEKESYQKLRDEAIEVWFEKLIGISSYLEDAKQQILAETESLLNMKAELFGIKEGQNSNTFTNTDGTRSIKIGFNIVDRWDDSKSAGLEKVNQWIEKQMRDSNHDIIGLVRELLKPNKDGELKANRVLDLSNHANKIGDTELIQAVSILREAYRPDRTGIYIKASEKKEDGVRKYIPLSLSSV